VSSVFTQIIEGRLPAYVVYQDELVIAILAREQVQLGHTLVIPKKEFDQWIDLDEATYVHLQKISLKLGVAIKKATQCERVLTATIGYEVHHYHHHLIPSWSMADFSFSKAKVYPDAEMTRIQKEIINHLRS